MTTRRGTTNKNARGSTEDRRRRREWLVDTFRADVDIWVVEYNDSGEPSLTVTRVVGSSSSTVDFSNWDTPPWWATLTPVWEKVCRCYRCGKFLTVDTVTVDRRVPGCQGGTYRRDNIRPACGPCNSSEGGKIRSK